MKKVLFSIGDAGEKYEMWASGFHALPAFLESDLPALFDRTLTFTELNLTADSRLEWTFTGTQGICKIALYRDRLSLITLFHDSFSCHEGEPLHWSPWERLSRPPEQEWSNDCRTNISISKSMSLRYEHSMDLVLSIDGQEIIRRHCVMDFRHHQLTLLNGGSAKGVMNEPKPQKASLTLNPDEKYQPVWGFGGTSSPFTYQKLSDEGKRKWWEMICENNFLLQRDNPVSVNLNRNADNWDDPAAAIPHYYGDNWNIGEQSDFLYNKAIKELGGDTIFEFWEYPDWVRSQRNTENCSSLRDEVIDADAYCDAMLGYCQKHFDIVGKAPGIVGVQNEICQSAEQLREMIPLLRKRLDDAGFNETKIHEANTPSLYWHKDFHERHKKYSGVWDRLDFTTANLYDAQEHFKNMDGYDSIIQEMANKNGDKPFFVTEVCVLFKAWQISSYRCALASAQMWHKMLTIANAEALCGNYMLVHNCNPSYNWTRTFYSVDETNNNMPAPMGYTDRVLASYSRFIRNGMYRVSCECSDPDILATAFANEKDGTLVLINRSCTAKEVQLENLFFTPLSCELTDHSHRNAKGIDIYYDNKVTVPPGGIVSLSSLEIRHLPETFNTPMHKVEGWR